MEDFSTLKEKIGAGELSCEELTGRYVEKLKGAQTNAFIFVDTEEVLATAKKIDKKISQGKAGRLAGLVCAVKDNLCLAGQKTTCGSRILHNYIPPYTATAIQRLLDQDAIIIGKTNMDEFAMGSSTETSAYGPVLNPHDPQRVPGGSSGGSAAAVAAHQCMASIGTDTGGSIRQPASFCGVYGLKPTYGRISRFGLIAYASSLDQIGPITRSVEDAAEMLSVLAGPDPRDSTCVQTGVPDYFRALSQDIKGLKIGLPREYFAAGLDKEVRAAIENQSRMLEKAGAECIELSLPHTEYAIACYYILATAEASSNLERYDGARYGFRDEQADNLEEMYTRSRTAGFGAEVKRRIMLGTYVLSAGYYDAYYRRAQKVRTLVRRDFDEAFSRVDCLLTPTCPTTAFQIGERVQDPLTMYLSDVYTVSVNLAGLPAISIPGGMDSQGLPIGSQLIGRHFDESMLFRIAHFLEQNV